jgi:excinuclease ABC subunit A
VVPDPELSIAEGAVAPWSSSRLEYWDRVLESVAETNGFSTGTPWKRLSKKARDVVMYGSDAEIHVRYKNRYGRTRSYWTTYEGVIPAVERRHVETDSDSQRERLEEFMREIPCRACGGARLRAETLAVTVSGINISQLTDRSIRDTLAFT